MLLIFKGFSEIPPKKLALCRFLIRVFFMKKSAIGVIFAPHLSYIFLINQFRAVTFVDSAQPV
ncbi:hypothetical protein CFBP1573P_03601 [Pseudomonas syringae pv. persicae]|uniref:Uncharacterized protein n=1 Tax=Pseudomonas syringae pv. persicae TaxID=237306 RepID=A0AB38EG95_9PSED|nr:hypothetical protein CFBP1573P_03601 [Pseudomonas syringae pv. persicae]SOQ11546.1 hypothetical protein NCPPB2254_03389 [Pseudomonas syringae pv. persicae]